MLEILQSIVAFIVTLGILVTFHEFGHFWVARRLGIKILRFSVGFGRPLWGRRVGPDQTEFVLAAIPLGGYVKMLDEREGEVAEDQLHRAFNRQSLSTRMAVVVAGPAANFLLAVVVYWLMFILGITALKPIVGEVAPGSIADKAGFEAGYEILSINDEPAPTWPAFIQTAVKGIVNAQKMSVEVQKGATTQAQLTVDLSAVRLDDIAQGDLLKRIGLTAYRPAVPPVIDAVTPDGAAHSAGMVSGDRVIEADGESIQSWNAWVKFVQARPEQPFQVVILRDDKRVMIDLVPKRKQSDGKEVGFIGAAVAASALDDSDYFGVERYPPTKALTMALAETWDASMLTLKVFGKMLLGQVSVKNLSGPITIANYAGKSADIGLAAFLAFLGIVSVSLGVLNLLPIPLLDGGHLMYYLVELVSRRPVSEATQLVGQQVGIALLGMMMVVAFYNDITRLFN